MIRLSRTLRPGYLQISMVQLYGTELSPSIINSILHRYMFHFFSILLHKYLFEKEWIDIKIGTRIKTPIK